VCHDLEMKERVKRRRSDGVGRILALIVVWVVASLAAWSTLSLPDADVTRRPDESGMNRFADSLFCAQFSRLHRLASSFA